MPKKVRVEGIQRDTPDTQMVAVALWIQSKRILRERRENEKRARAKRQRREREHE